MLGLPFVTASLPHSPQLVQALTLVQPKSGSSTDPASPVPSNTLHVAENRLTPLLMYLLLGTPLFAPSLLSSMPEVPPPSLSPRPTLPRHADPHAPPITHPSAA